MFTNFLWISNLASGVQCNIFLYKNVIRYYVEAVKAFFYFIICKIKKNDRLFERRSWLVSCKYCP